MILDVVLGWLFTLAMLLGIGPGGSTSPLTVPGLQDGQEVARVASPSGEHVVVIGTRHDMIDPLYDVSIAVAGETTEIGCVNGDHSSQPEVVWQDDSSVTISAEVLGDSQEVVVRISDDDVTVDALPEGFESC